MVVSLDASVLEVGQKAPDFTLLADDGQLVTLSAQEGKKVILYFYPKDDTPGCTQQACNFRDYYQEFAAKGVVIFGVSKDSILSHQKFKTKYHLNFPLLTDADGTVCKKYGVWQQKTMFGKFFPGIERTTFLIDETGHIQEIWRKVKVAGHFQEVLKAL